jgi:Arc/MetJ family transcription regulator
MTAAVTRRARSMAELAALQARAFNPEQLGASIISCLPRPDDVIISPYAKCGTTWLQQMFHTLRTQGDLDFDDISRVVPWIETARMLDIDLEAPQRASPRGFKSHLAYDVVPKGARYIVSFRDPRDAVLSHFRFIEGWWLEPGAVTMTEYVASRIAMRGSKRDYWHHLMSWWAERDNPNILLRGYEQMSADPVSTIRRVAAFCGIPLDDALLALTLERTSLSFMLAHKRLFDDKMMREMTERRLGLPAEADSAKVRVGRVGSHEREMPAEAISMLDAAWSETVTPKLGFRNYAELEEALRESGGER